MEKQDLARTACCVSNWPARINNGISGLLFGTFVVLTCYLFCVPIKTSYSLTLTPLQRAFEQTHLCADRKTSGEPESSGAAAAVTSLEGQAGRRGS